MLSGSRDGEFLRVKQTLDFQHGLHVLALIGTLSRAVFRRTKLGKLRFPITQHMRLHSRNLRHFPDFKEKLVRNGSHQVLSGRLPVPLLTTSFKIWLGLKDRTRRGEISICVPVFGLRPSLFFLFRTRKLPKPTM